MPNEILKCSWILYCFKEECAYPNPGINIWEWDLAHCPWKKANEPSPQGVYCPRLTQEADFQALQTGFGSCQLAELSISITTLSLYNLQLWSFSYTVLTHLPYMLYNIPADSRYNPSLHLSLMKKESTAFVKKAWACRYLISWTTPEFSLEIWRGITVWKSLSNDTGGTKTVIWTLHMALDWFCLEVV